MKYNLIDFKSKALSFALLLALTILSANFNIPVSAQYKSYADTLDRPGGDLTVVASYPLSGVKLRSAIVPEVVDANAFYSDVTTFLGQGVLNGGAALVGANTITALVADDLTFTRGVPVNVVQYRFTVANANTTAVSFRPRIRFYANNAGAPGTLIGGNTFNAVSVPAGNVTIFTSPLNTATPFAMTTQTIWAGITFDNNSGATGATLAQLNNLGQGVYNPPDRGSSADSAFRTTAAGDFLANNPAGASFNTTGVIDNYGWELISAAPVAAQVSIGGRVMTSDGQGISKASVTFSDANGMTRTAITNGFGYYRFDNVQVGATYVLSAASKRYQFSQSQQVMFIEDAKDDINFVAQ